VPKKKLPKTAVASGQAGVVVFCEGQECKVRWISTPAYAPCLRSDIAYIFSDATDTVTIEARSPEQAYRIMESEWEKDRCLHLLLILLDSSAHLYARRLASTSLETLLHSDSTQTFVCHRLYSRPLPATSDIAGPLEVATIQSLRLLWNLLKNLQQAQKRITDVRERWEMLDASLFGDFHLKNAFEQVAIEEGVFFGLGRISEQTDTRLAESWMTNPRFKDFENSSKILALWARPFLKPRIEPEPALQGRLFDDKQSG
jgi:hypothetical protein